jgi:hypothetical protein
MHGREKRVVLREYLDQGWSKNALARKLGVGRSTIHRWIVGGQLERDLDGEAVHYRARPVVPGKIYPYRGIIDHRLQEFPKLSSVRLYQELQAASYSGGYTQVKEHVRVVRPTALLVVLSYSQLMWLRFFRRHDMATLFCGLEQAFRYFRSTFDILISWRNIARHRGSANDGGWPASLGQPLSHSASNVLMRGQGCALREGRESREEPCRASPPWAAKSSRCTTAGSSTSALPVSRGVRILALTPRPGDSKVSTQASSGSLIAVMTCPAVGSFPSPVEANTSAHTNLPAITAATPTASFGQANAEAYPSRVALFFSNTSSSAAVGEAT